MARPVRPHFGHFKGRSYFSRAIRLISHGALLDSTEAGLPYSKEPTTLGQTPGHSYGGYKESGIGREFSLEGMLESYTQRKNVTVNLVR